MKVEEFRENFELDVTTKRGIKARRKNGAKELPEAKTADGEIFSPEEKYFFFDQSGRVVRQTSGLHRFDSEFLGSFGLRICKISELRTNRADALADAQEFYRGQIREFQEKIIDLEMEKTAQ